MDLSIVCRKMAAIGGENDGFEGRAERDASSFMTTRTRAIMVLHGIVRKQILGLMYLRKEGT